ncbi:MAG TPA: transporter associated domain-containing protein, partial [Candidatus Hydrogenedentes bacterium]|nr:transporter associated domain-containing protein [Candidatus Hydrogenedentota bacterium]
AGSWFVYIVDIPQGQPTKFRWTDDFCRTWHDGGPVDDQWHALSGGTWMVGGGFPAAQLRSIIGAELPHAHGSLSAWLIERIGKLPNRNSIHKEGDVAFMIRRIRRGKIFEVAVSTGGVPLPLP